MFCITFNSKNIDPGKNMETLFREYFTYSKGQEPNKEITSLFTEILAEEDKS